MRRRSQLAAVLLMVGTACSSTTVVTSIGPNGSAERSPSTVSPGSTIAGTVPDPTTPDAVAVAQLLYDATPPDQVMRDSPRHWEHLSGSDVPGLMSVDSFTLGNAKRTLTDPLAAGVHVYVFDSDTAAARRRQAIVNFQTSETIDTGVVFGSGWTGLECGRLLVALSIKLGNVDALNPLVSAYEGVLQAHGIGSCERFEG